METFSFDDETSVHLRLARISEGKIAEMVSANLIKWRQPRSSSYVEGY